MNVTTPTGVPDDEYWQRPDPNSAGEPDRPAPTPGPTYPGPPRTPPPSANWRPPTIASPPPPRSLPPQDMDAIDESEGSARTITYGVGLVASAIALILLCLLCARFLF